MASFSAMGSSAFAARRSAWAALTRAALLMESWTAFSVQVCGGPSGLALALGTGMCVEWQAGTELGGGGTSGSSGSLTWGIWGSAFSTSGVTMGASSSMVSGLMTAVLIMSCKSTSGVLVGSGMMGCSTEAGGWPSWLSRKCTW